MVLDMKNKGQLTLDNLENKQQVKPQIKQPTYDSTVFCIYCLYKGKLYKFKVVDKKEYKVECPECGRTFLMVTLKSMYRMTRKKIEAYAKWVYRNRRRFWINVNNPVWSNRLKEYRWAGTFWSTYRRIKAGLSRPEQLDIIEEDYDYSYAEKRSEKRGEG